MDTYAHIRKAAAAVLIDLHMAWMDKPARTKLMHGWRSNASLDTSPVVWYYKDSPVDLVFNRVTGFAVLDHVRRQRSPRINNLGAALHARAFTLKAAIDEASRLAAQAQTAGLQEAGQH